MNLNRITLCWFCLIIALLSWGCAKSNQLAVTMVYEAKTQINAAEQEGATELAPESLIEAESYLTKAEKAFKDDRKEAYRLAKRAYLKARYAEVIAKRNKAERMADVEEAKLEKLLREAEEARRKHEDAERKLDLYIQ